MVESIDWRGNHYESNPSLDYKLGKIETKQTHDFYKGATPAQEVKRESCPSYHITSRWRILPDGTELRLEDNNGNRMFGN